MTTANGPAEDTRPLSAREWIELLFDEGSFDEQYTGIPTPDPLRFEDSQPYPERLEEARRKTGDSEAVVTGSARIGGFRVIVAVSDFRFIGGSMGYVVGERVAHAMDRAEEAKIPFVAVTCSGGARMQEGMVALIQLAKTTAAAARLHEAGIPMISVLANPTTGGVFASYGTQADVLIAEAGALIGFAGPRVRAVHDEGDDRETLYAEDLQGYGQVDLVAPRQQLRDQLLTVVSLMQRTAGPDPDRLPPPVEVRGQDRGWTVVERARDPERPRALHYIRALASDFVPLRGDRSGEDDPALVGGLARLGDTNVVVIGQERGDMDLKGRRHDGRVSPAGYRKAKRLMLLADRLRLPLITFVDTPGARDGISDEQAGLAASISDCLTTMASITTPSVAVVIGEGGSGGALALTWADRILMQQNAMYAITSPEGAAAILFRDRERAPEVAEALGVSAGDIHKLGIIDAVVPEPAGGAHLDPEGAVRLLRPELRRALADAMRGRGSQRRNRRERRLREIGLPHEESAAFLRNIGDVLGDLGGAIGSRLRRRGGQPEAGGAEGGPASAETEHPEAAPSRT
ncbi:MAG: acetyl-CoA carboxylase carboxyl transferase subunit beta [Dehalococcoidia bacterium]|nr:acetyl-CoA carboxylase carboxyl transferase subunit beta [Dehalococcoidia bacterium]MCA9856409.1 acetyl-CoA carboxylase carboxyl transferase subunit beta [Dehalococcoidia bacterium]MCB9483680.1 acetyl-CoA carboxylase carboxyl transferase subunit beta [Dehalococcoidia bacterium]MCB9491118.1 acetyl-CoA carboxylase carboxyl transferase subunit beta [Dehalococcoidia bacterium]